MREPEFTAEARRLLGPDKLLVVLTRAEGDAAAVSAHLAAGAGHATPGLPVGTDFAAGVDHLERLAPAALRPR